MSYLAVPTKPSAKVLRIYKIRLQAFVYNLKFIVWRTSYIRCYAPSEGLNFYTGDLFLAECSASGSNNKKERICKVGFSGKGMRISVLYKGEWWAYTSMNFTTAKVIGNIHENPELLSTPTAVL